MNSKVEITIGITAYNDWKYLEKAIQSVLDQTSNEWTGVLVLDGGCDYKTQSIFESFDHYKFKKYSFNDNQGPPKTREKAIELCETKWYFHLDGDDLLPPESIKYIVQAIKQNPDINFIYGNCEHFSDDINNMRKPIDDFEDLCLGPLFNTQSPIKKSLYYHLGGFDYNEDLVMNFDWDFWLTVFEKNIKGFQLNNTLYKRRNRVNNIGNRKMSLGPISVDYIIKKHPIFFNSIERKNRAKYNIYEKIARNYKAKGKRKLAYHWAKEAAIIGPIHEGLENIFKEEKMSPLRYLIRRFSRRFFIFKKKYFK